jgi:plastocyanin
VTVGGRAPVDAPVDAYVYVENVATVRTDALLEIKQIDKQFHPRTAAIQVGTRLLFSNSDRIFHNVFSLSPNYRFDLGFHRAGDAPQAVETAAPGVIAVSCRLHCESATVLVVPNGLFTRVERDGSFELHNVPLGTRHITAWAPDATQQTREVELQSEGAELLFSLKASAVHRWTDDMGILCDDF